MWPFRSLCLVFLFSLPAMAEQPQRVLVIHSFGRDFAPFHVEGKPFFVWHNTTDGHGAVQTPRVMVFGGSHLGAARIGDFKFNFFAQPYGRIRSSAPPCFAARL